jgi:hypothetical protein
LRGRYFDPAKAIERPFDHLGGDGLMHRRATHSSFVARRGRGQNIHKIRA